MFFFLCHLLAVPTTPIVLQQTVFLLLCHSLHFNISAHSWSEQSLSSAGLQGAQGAKGAHGAHLHRAQLHQQLRLKPLRPLGRCATVTFGKVASVQAGAVDSPIVAHCGIS